MGKIPLMTGPMFGIIFNIIAMIALETTYLTSKIDSAIKDNKPTDKELITIENVQFVKAILHLSNMILNLFRYVLGITRSTPSLYALGSIDIIKLTTKTKIILINPEPRLPAMLSILIKLS